MSETDWELKDRRMAYESLMKSICSIQASLIESKMVKFNSLKDALADVKMSLQVEFEAFLCIKNDTSHKTDVGGPSAGDEPSFTSSSPNKSEPFLKDVGSKPFVGASPSSPQKEKKLKGEKKTGWVCSECQAAIEVWVKDYSETNMGKSLCYSCQDKYRERREQIENASGPKDIGKY